MFGGTFSRIRTQEILIQSSLQPTIATNAYSISERTIYYANIIIIIGEREREREKRRESKKLQGFFVVKESIIRMAPPAGGGGRHNKGRGTYYYGCGRGGVGGSSGGGSRIRHHIFWGFIWMLIMCVTPLAWFGYNFHRKGFIVPHLDVLGTSSSNGGDEIRGEIIALETTNMLLKNELERARAQLKELQKFKIEIMKTTNGGCGANGNGNGTIISVQDLESNNNVVAANNNNLDVIMEENSEHWMLHQQLKRREQQKQRANANTNNNSNSTTTTTGTTSSYQKNTATLSSLSSLTKSDRMEFARSKLKQARLNGKTIVRYNRRPPLPKQNEKIKTDRR